MVCRDEAGEHVDRAESRIPRRDAVLAFGFQEAQEAGDALRRKVGDLEPLDGALAIVRGELEQQQQRVAVAADGVRAHAALRGQVVLEKAHEVTAEIGGFGESHDAPPSSDLHRMSARIARLRVRRRQASSAGNTPSRRSTRGPCRARAWANCTCTSAPVLVPPQQRGDREAMPEVLHARPASALVANVHRVNSSVSVRPYPPGIPLPACVTDERRFCAAYRSRRARGRRDSSAVPNASWARAAPSGICGTSIRG